MSSLFCFFYIDQVYRWLSRETLKTWYKWCLYVYMHTSSKWNSIHFITCLRVTQTMLLLFSHPDMSNSLQPQGLQHSRPPCPSPSHRVWPSSYPLHQWCHPAISSSVALFSFCPQSFPASGTFPMSQLFVAGDQNTGTSASTWKLCEVCVLVAQSYPTLCDPMYCRPPGSSVHGILQERILEWVALLPSGNLLTQGLNPGLLHWRQILYQLSHQGSPRML